MERAKVFSSSVLDLKLEDLRGEREAVRRVIESYRFLTAWAFEQDVLNGDRGIARR